MGGLFILALAVWLFVVGVSNRQARASAGKAFDNYLAVTARKEIDRRAAKKRLKSAFLPAPQSQAQNVKPR